ncbi:uncharacterized protein GGS22DRAFT_199011 [Annulohypoxylon maeteangense]|uniref:uncharacterized protein n=1 Tax=Annulohypoxylon maeteangense TaxID=1927788 RepID=UPI002007703F|nr:uncharacterized protein GGS22DRAFT_199011 [Annulohypoxylon maeteangense]KAI0886608.1 hypothetical protein GGS22DRAFT_199011 [Annulohypoxylon maeteangense]
MSIVTNEIVATEPENHVIDNLPSEKKDLSPEGSADNEKIIGDETTNSDNDAQATSEKGEILPTPRETSSDENYITFYHDDNKEFIIPWTICKTWKGMKDFIKLSYRNDEDAKTEIDEDKFDLYVDRSFIFPHTWEDLVQRGWGVSIRLNSKAHLHQDEETDSDREESEDENEKDETDENFEGKYEVKTTYTIDYYEKRYGDDELLFTTSHDDAIELNTSGHRGKKVSILEEKTTVMCRRRYNRRPDSVLKRAPKLDDGDRIEKKHLVINSPLLINALRSVVKYASDGPSGDEVDDLKAGKFSHPYRDLFYYRQELIDFKNQTTGIRSNHSQRYNEECDKHIDFLLKFLENEPTVQVKALEARWAKKVPTTTFAGLWLLLKPGSDVYVLQDGQLNAYVVDSISGGVEHFFRGLWSVSIGSYTVRLWNLVYNGKVITRRSKEVVIPVFDNERNITSLPVFPTRFQDQMDGGLRRKQLIERGQKLFQFAKGPAFLEYTGSGLRPGWKKYNRARVVIEHESRPWINGDFDRILDWELDEDEYSTEIRERARTPHCECTACNRTKLGQETYVSGTFSDYDDIDPKRSLPPTEHQSLICMSHMFGFVLKDRMYDLIDVGGLSTPRIAKDAIDQLVMRPASNKETIKAIVQTYTDTGSQAELFSADFIHGKGEGQIFLLHGPPGTGKTLTAESVAEYTKRPLLSITAADLGHEPIELEKNLLRFFKDANNWDAIVLLDEADIYLERRSTNDLRRNSIVSIFLRALDYFQGILFLTTNRVGHFDEAFLSRIHVAIGYETLDDAAREQIWDNLFKKLKDDHKHGGPEIHYEYEAKQYVKKDDELKSLEWNGREIRNAFQSAVALAIYDSRVAREKGVSVEDSVPEVKESHVKQIAKMSTAFKNYMTSTHEGVKDSDLAYKIGIRNDKFNVSQGTEIPNFR